MGRLGHLDPSILLNFYLKQWNELWSGSSGNMLTTLEKFLKCNTLIVGTKGTDTALSTLVNMIESSILRKELCLVVSVDMQGAFDNFATIAINKVMVDNKYPPPLMIRWYMNFLKNRTSIAEVLGVMLAICLVCGIWRSRIWNLAFDPLLRLLNQNSPCAPVGFTDDGALCFRGICPDRLVEIAQPKINFAVEWGSQNGLFFL